eukprot:14102753-Alexandrium_andersonii.AAC.1
MKLPSQKAPQGETPLSGPRSRRKNKYPEVSALRAEGAALGAAPRRRELQLNGSTCSTDSETWTRTFRP